MDLSLDGPVLADRTGKGVTVAVLDSGIAAGHPHVGDVMNGITIDALGQLHEDFRDRIGHGTAVAAAIREKAPDVKLLAVRIFDRSLRTNADQLVAAMRWAADQGARIINLSLGTPNPDHRHSLEHAVQFALDHGCLTVAARDAQGTPLYPGSLQDAISVTLDAAIPRDCLRVHEPPEMVFAASGLPRPIPGVPPERNLSGISFSVANVSGFLARVCEGRDKPTSQTELLNWLGSHS